MELKIITGGQKKPGVHFRSNILNVYKMGIDKPIVCIHIQHLS